VPDVSYSLALRWIILPLLLLTLGWKVAVQLSGSQEGGQPGGSQEGTKSSSKIAEFLVRQRFTVATFQNAQVGEPAIQASAGDCRILIAESRSDGSDQDRLRHYATARDTVFVVFGGRIYAEQPTWLTTFDYLWSKFLRELGSKAPATPVFTVIATKSCGAERLPWTELG
jgi:hypothetical protein